MGGSRQRVVRRSWTAGRGAPDYLRGGRVMVRMMFSHCYVPGTAVAHFLKIYSTTSEIVCPGAWYDVSA